MEAGIRRECPRVGGTARVTGTEEKTAFSLSTDTESDLSLIWRKRFLKPLKYPVGTSVERSLQRFRSIISDEDKLSRQELSR